jgi:hypothetical protein
MSGREITNVNIGKHTPQHRTNGGVLDATPTSQTNPIGQMNPTNQTNPTSRTGLSPILCAREGDSDKVFR